MKKIFAGIIAALLVTAAYAQNAGTVTNHAYAIGKGAGVAGYTSLLCASGQLALGSATDPTCRTMSGDATLSATGVLTLATVNANVGTFGSATQAPQITLDGKGRATAATSLTVTPAVGSITGLGAGCATWLGTPSSANLRGCLTDESGTGLAYFQGGDLGTPSAGVGSNLSALNASSLTLGTVAAARGGAGTITGALRGSGAGVVTQAACADLSDGSGACAQTYTATTWTPTLTTDATPGTPVYNLRVGSYERIGRLVVAHFTLSTSSWGGSPTGNVQMTGLPVASANTASDNGTCFIGSYGVTSLPASNFGVGGIVLPNTTAVLLTSNGATATASLSAANFGATGQIIGTCFYHT